MWSNVGDGESVGGGVGVVIMVEGGVALEEVNSVNGVSIDLTHQLDTPPSLQAYTITVAGTGWGITGIAYIINTKIFLF